MTYHEILILEMLTVHPDMYLSELCNVRSAIGTLASNSTISHVLKRHGYTKPSVIKSLSRVAPASR